MKIIYVLLCTLIIECSSEGNEQLQHIPFTIHTNRKSPCFELSNKIFDALSHHKNCTLLVLENINEDWVESPNFVLNGTQIHASKQNRNECSWKSSYALAIARQCETEKFNMDRSLKIRVNLDNSNEHVPRFNEDHYFGTYVAGREPYDILKVSAYDADCLNNHEPCNYRIKNNNVPFLINSNGFIRTNQTLFENTTNGDHYQFNVSAVDCFDQSESEQTQITVHIVQPCSPFLEITSQRGSRPTRYPFQNIDIHLCSYCQPADIVLKFELKFGTDSKNVCEKPKCHEGYEVQLLNDYDSTLVGDKPPSQQSEYKFNGHDDFLAIENLNNINHLSEISFWMKGFNPSSDTIKQQIVCKGDKHSLNRHHFSIYLLDHKLKMLLRHDPQPEPAAHEFFPSLWQWDISKLNSSEWNFFKIVINDDWQLVRLYVNDSEHELQLNNVAKSLPLESLMSDENINTSTVSGIGACWHGRSQRWSQHFQGKLGKFKVTTRKLRDSSCSRKCVERLNDDHNVDAIKTWEIAFNENNNIAIVRGQNSQQIKSALQKLEYVADDSCNVTDTLAHISGTLICKNMPKQIFPAVYMILKSKQVNMIVNEHRVVRSGKMRYFQPFSNITLLSTIANETAAFEYCKVYIDPVPFDTDQVQTLSALNVKVTKERDGSFLIKGKMDINLKLFLDNIVFISASESDASKRFDLSCWSKQKGQLFHSLYIENSKHSQIVRRSLNMDATIKSNIPIKGMVIVCSLAAAICSLFLAYILINSFQSVNKHTRVPQDEFEMHTLRAVPCAQVSDIKVMDELIVLQDDN